MVATPLQLVREKIGLFLLPIALVPFLWHTIDGDMPAAFAALVDASVMRWQGLAALFASVLLVWFAAGVRLAVAAIPSWFAVALAGAAASRGDATDLPSITSVATVMIVSLIPIWSTVAVRSGPRPSRRNERDAASLIVGQLVGLAGGYVVAALVADHLAVFPPNSGRRWLDLFGASVGVMLIGWAVRRWRPESTPTRLFVISTKIRLVHRVFLARLAAFGGLMGALAAMTVGIIDGHVSELTAVGLLGIVIGLRHGAGMLGIAVAMTPVALVGLLAVDARAGGATAAPVAATPYLIAGLSAATAGALARFRPRMRRVDAAGDIQAVLWLPVLASAVVLLAEPSLLFEWTFSPVFLAVAVVLPTWSVPALIVVMGPLPIDRFWRHRAPIRSRWNRLMRRFLRHRRSGAVLLDLGISTYNSARRLRHEDAERAVDDFRRSFDYFDEFLEQAHGSVSSPEKREQWARAECYRARCLKGVAETGGDHPRAQASWREVKRLLEGFEHRFEGLDDVVLRALITRLRAECELVLRHQAIRTVGALERLASRDPRIILAHRRLAGMLLDTMDEVATARDERRYRVIALRSYRAWLLATRPDDPHEWLRVGAGIEALGSEDRALDIYQLARDHFEGELPQKGQAALFELLRRLGRLAQLQHAREIRTRTYHIMNDPDSREFPELDQSEQGDV